MRFCTDTYFYEKLCLKINWNLDRAPLKTLVDIQDKLFCTKSNLFNWDIATGVYANINTDLYQY